MPVSGSVYLHASYLQYKSNLGAKWYAIPVYFPLVVKLSTWPCTMYRGSPCPTCWHEYYIAFALSTTLSATEWILFRKEMSDAVWLSLCTCIWPPLCAAKTGASMPKLGFLKSSNVALVSVSATNFEAWYSRFPRFKTIQGLGYVYILNACSFLPSFSIQLGYKCRMSL